MVSTTSTDEEGEHIFSVMNEKVIGIKQRFHLAHRQLEILVGALHVPDNMNQKQIKKPMAKF